MLAETEQPGQGYLRLARVACACHVDEPFVLRQSPDPTRATERRVGDERDPELAAAIHDPAAERAVVEDAQRDLHCGDRREVDGFVQLRAGDVADADSPDEAVVDEPRERADGRAPGRPRIGCVQEIQVDLEPGERLQARLAIGPDRLRATVRYPRAVGSRHSTLRHDPCSSDVAERPRERALHSRS